jgi:hypothetical protein
MRGIGTRDPTQAGSLAKLVRRMVAVGSWTSQADDFETSLQTPESNVAWASSLFGAVELALTILRSYKSFQSPF